MELVKTTTVLISSMIRLLSPSTIISATSTSPWARTAVFQRETCMHVPRHPPTYMIHDQTPFIHTATQIEKKPATFSACKIARD
eukprot:m.70777 g.70777  ORF g.70777 m.70777 type:complete len:84 (-) comp24273_c0_seq1:202-453(-)